MRPKTHITNIVLRRLFLWRESARKRAIQSLMLEYHKAWKEMVLATTGKDLDSEWSSIFPFVDRYYRISLSLRKYLGERTFGKFKTGERLIKKGGKHEYQRFFSGIKV